MPALSRLAINEEGFVFNPDSGDSFHVSPTGLLILNGFRQRDDDSRIARMLSEEYAVSLEDATGDVADFRAQLKNHGLI